MSYTNIQTDSELAAFCARLPDARRIAFDTEFVSEHSYRPELCLVQVAADDHLALIDPMAIADMTPFWRALAEPGHETIVHAGRGELEFSLAAIGSPPAGLFDVQIAAGLAGLEYPASYGNLIGRLLGEKPNKGETRTDWRRRPLTQRQIDYALDDIRHLIPLRDALGRRLTDLDRADWLVEEMASWVEEVQRAVSNERWRRVSGNSGLSRRCLAVLRELWRWREAEAERRDCTARRVLRDDLLVELAKRQTADPKRIQAVRGMERGDLNRQLPKLAEAITRGLKIPENECPAAGRPDNGPQLSVLGQFLFAALGSLCRERQLAPGLVGSPNDVRDLIAFRTGRGDMDRVPRLERGWRAQVAGQIIDDLVAGRLAVRIVAPESDSPLAFEPRT